MPDGETAAATSITASNRGCLEFALEQSARNEGNKEYLQLRRLIAERGLLDRQYVYYAFNVLLSLATLAGGIATIIIFDELWVQLLNAALMAVVFGQFSFMGHDAGHRQIFRLAKHNDLLFLLATLVTGITPSWWQEKHNAHHRNPNQVDLDDDINIPVYAFTQERALQTRGIVRSIVKRQAFLLYLFHCLTSLVLLGRGVEYLFHRKKLRYPAAEVIAVLAGIGLYFAIPILFLPPLHAVLFFVVHRALSGLYMGLVFAPNHKGMPVFGSGVKLDYLRRQVLTSRNLLPSPVVDLAFGGLNYQIEHHLFPNMPRNRLKKARPIVKAFCRERGIPYHETGFWKSQKEILGYLHEVGAPLREKRTEGCPASSRRRATSAAFQAIPVERGPVSAGNGRSHGRRAF